MAGAHVEYLQVMKRTSPFVLSLAAAVACAAAGFLGAPALAGESLYARAANTEVRATASPAGAIQAKLDIGAKCDVLAKEGNWTKVKAEVNKKAVTGYVFSAKLSKDKPDKERVGGKSVATASEGDTALALRGLSPTAEGYAGRASISAADVAAVKKMEQQKIAQEELATFLKDGKLAEYQN